ncbi:MAG: 6-phosphogluconolactonase [Prochloron sp. SP5CPC1]|nr:6-phosphogluconolactonase [Candidatus Paraprochloron terpiosi SP5CPC1]
MKKFVEVFPDKQALLARALVIVTSQIQAAIQEKGKCTIALAGGSTPKPLYESIATQNLPTDKIHLFWSDERYVPPEHPDSNQRMVRKAWLDRVDFSQGNIHPMPTGAGNPTIDAQNHERELLAFFQITAGEFPVFDLILLGMGDDGHTASLFPHTEALSVKDRLVTVGNKDGQPRLTFTASLINHANCVLFLVAGANKRPALEQVFASSADPMTYPSRLIMPQGELWWLLDQAASI